jgi:hypothetical protein
MYLTSSRVATESAREAWNAPLWIEGVYADKLVLLLRALSILPQETRNVLVIVNISSHGARNACRKRMKNGREMMGDFIALRPLVRCW